LVETKKILIQGKNIEETFSNCGKALFKEITDIEKIDPKKSAKLRVSGKTYDELLVNYLNELLLLRENKKMIYSQFRVKIIEKISENGENSLELDGVVFGEKPKNKGLIKKEIKRITNASVDKEKKTAFFL